MAGLDPADDRRRRAGHHHARPADAGNAAAVQDELGLRCGAFDVNAACSGFVYGLVTAHGLIAMGADTRARDRHRHAVPHHRLGRPQHRDPVRRRLRRRRARGRSTGRASCSAGTSTPTARSSRSSTPSIGGYIQMDGKEVFRRAVRVMVDSADEVDGARRRHRRRHRPGRAPPGQHPHHRGRLRAARHPDGARRDRARPHRQHVVGVDPARARRRARRRPGRRRRPRAARRLRRRHDLRPAPCCAGAACDRTATRGDGRVVLVTGGSRGIGLACARALRGARRPGRRHLPLVAAARRPASASRATSPSADEVDAAFAAVEAEFGGRSRCSCPTPASPATGCCCA